MTVNEMQFGFMPERGTIGAVFILRRMQEENHVCVFLFKTGILFAIR